MTRTRIVGTVEEAIAIEESLLGRKLPRSFRRWLLEYNGSDMADIRVFPVRDERDTRKTWESLDYNFRHDWVERLEVFSASDYSHLLPFAEPGTGDVYCFDYSEKVLDGEYPVVIWSSETGKIEKSAASFDEFKTRILDAAPK